MFDNDIKITGKHASYIKFLAQKTTALNKDAVSAGIFKCYIDVYMAGVIIGAVKNRKAEVDNSIDDSANILAAVVINEQAKLKFLYRIVMLTDDTTLTPDVRIDKAFRYDSDAEKVKEGMAIFNSYARGGIEWLYENITDGAISQEDYIRRLQEIISEYDEDYSFLQE